MARFEEMSLLLQKGKANDLVTMINEELANGVSASDILNNALISGINVVGEKFKNNQVFIPEVLITARAMNMALQVLRPILLGTGVKPVGKAIICTVKGDRHDIGKNLVKIMLEGNGIECTDLGVDVSESKIVEAVKSSDAKILCLSALLTTTMVNIEVIINALKSAGVRDKVKVMVGGAPVTEEFAKKVGADAYTDDASSAAKKALELLGL